MIYECELTDPKVLDSTGSLVDPSSDDKSFQFSKKTCTSTATDSARLIDISNESQIAVGLSDYFSLSYVFLVIVVFSLLFLVAKTFFDRN